MRIFFIVFNVKVLYLAILLVLIPAISFSQQNYNSFEKVHAFYENSAPRFTVNYVSMLEDTFGVPGREDAMNRLNRLFKEVYDTFKLHSKRSEKEAKDFFTVVDSLLQKHQMKGIALGGKFERDEFLNSSLSKKYNGLACYYTSLVYSNLAKVYPFSVNPVIASDDHMFVRYESSSMDTSVNWETVSGKSHPDKYYIDERELSQQAIKNGCYLRSLSDKEALATIFRYMGSMLKKSDSKKEQLRFFKKAYELDTTRLNSLYSVAVDFSQNGMLDSAQIYLNKALAFDTSNVRTWYAHGVVYEETGEDDEAIRCYDQALKIDSLYGEALYRRARYAFIRGKKKRFHKLLERLKIHDMANILYIVRLERMIKEDE